MVILYVQYVKNRKERRQWRVSERQGTVHGTAGKASLFLHPHPLQPLPTIHLLRLMLQRAERDGFAVIGNLFQAGRAAVRQHEIALGDPEFFGCFLLSSHAIGYIGPGLRGLSCG